jgi:hypothetical protein
VVIAGTFFNNGLSSAGAPLGLITGTSWTNSATGTIRFELGGTIDTEQEAAMAVYAQTFASLCTKDVAVGAKAGIRCMRGRAFQGLGGAAESEHVETIEYGSEVGGARRRVA